MTSTPHDPQPGPTSTGPGECHCTSRREAMRAAGTLGVLAVGATSLAACGGGAQDAVGSAASAASSAASSVAAQIQAAEVPVGGGTVFDSLKVVVTQPTKGDFKAFSAVCPHQGCTVGSVADGKITCPCHGSQFDIATGDVITGPATSGLPAKKLTVGADGITLT
ncbi:MAG: Rieske (2Fe-2S) protein [Ornithinibacter sp.]